MLCDKLDEPKERKILEARFPVIIHAVFELDDYQKYSHDLLRVLKYLKQNEVIIHPVCHSVKSDSIDRLAEYNNILTEFYYENGIQVYIEINSKLDPINYLSTDIKTIFDC